VGEIKKGTPSQGYGGKEKARSKRQKGLVLFNLASWKGLRTPRLGGMFSGKLTSSCRMHVAKGPEERRPVLRGRGRDGKKALETGELRNGCDYPYSEA